MNKELFNLRFELNKNQSHNIGILRGCIADLVKDKSDRNLLNICLNAGILQDFFQETSDDEFFILRCKSKLIDEFFVNETIAIKAIEYCKFLSKKNIAEYWEDSKFLAESIKGLNIEWVNIPAGIFVMGSPLHEINRYKDEIQHQVTLGSFKMSKYEITFDQYKLFCDATGREKPSDGGLGRGNSPVKMVSWFDADAFSKWMGCRLPTEAEWEYACRSGTKTPFNTGDNLTTEQANYDGNHPYNNNTKGEYHRSPLTVGSFAPNAWGLYDMHGNVNEWCSDWYGEYSTSAQTNPKGPSSGPYRVYRGGSWGNYAEDCRTARRNIGYPDGCNGAIGFRLVSSE